MNLNPDVQRLGDLSRAPLRPPAVMSDKTTEEANIHTERERWPILDQATLYGVAGDVVRLIEPHTEADPMALLASFLAECGTMLNRSPHLVLDGCYNPLLLWPVLVGNTSKSRKGTTDKRIRGILALADPGWTRGEYKGTLSSGEGLAFAVRDPEYRDMQSKETGEPVRILVDGGVEDKRLFLVQGEFGAVLRVMMRDGNSLSGTMREAWDGLDLAPMTKANRIRATNPHVGIVGHTTRDELLKNLSDTEASNGFGNRFVWLAVKRSSRELPFASDPDADALATLAGKVGRTLIHARTIARIEMTELAQTMWKDIYHDLSAERPGLAGTLLARAEAQVMRLAALYAVLDGQRAIDAVHLDSALAFWRYAEASTLLIFGDATGDPLADMIYQAVRTSGELDDSQISALFHRNKPASRLDRAKTKLSEYGLLHCELIESGGRPRMLWRMRKTK